MGRRDAMWDIDRITRALLRLPHAAPVAAPPGKQSAELPLRVTVPAPVRAILESWAQDNDPAPLLPRGANAAALRTCYLTLARSAPPVRVRRAALQLLYANAAANAQFGLWSDLRSEAHAVRDWLSGIAATDPLLRARIGTRRTG